MSKRAYVCRACGGLRRREKVYGRLGADSPDWPRCCARPMEELSLVEAEGATKLRKAERLEWLARGKLVVRERGRWTPARTERARARAAEQRAAFAAAQRPPSEPRARAGAQRRGR